MDGTPAYPRNTVRRFLPCPASGTPLLFTLADCYEEKEQSQFVSITEYAKSVDRSAGSFFASLISTRQGS
jgi:hypothetical protein